MVLSKETSLFKKNSIKDDISNAGTQASSYIQEITNDGIFVHQIDSGKDGTSPTDATAYGVHVSGAIDIIRGGKVVASYGENTRIGPNDEIGKCYLVLTNTGFDIYWNSAQAGRIVKLFHCGTDFVDYSWNYQNSSTRGSDSFASGLQCLAAGVASRAGGRYSSTSTDATCAVAEGNSCEANGMYSRAIGDNTYTNARAAVASGEESKAEVDSSHALGCGVHSAGTTGQLVIGNYNIVPAARDRLLFIIGNGTDENHLSDCFTVDDQGNVHIHGNLLVDGTITN